MKTLVTGGAGFIGSTLVDRLLAEGHSVDVLDNLSSGSLANLASARSDRAHDFSFHQIDIRDPSVVELIGRRQPEVVFHLAAQADVRVSVRPAGVRRRGQHHRRPQRARGGPPGRVVSQGRVRLERRHDLRRRRARRDLPIDENQPQRPVSPYGVAKKVMGDYLYAYRELHALEFTALALANVYGPRQDPHGEAGVVAIFAGRLLAGEPCTIFGDGGQTRDFVFVDDVVDAFVRAADRGSGLLANIGTAVETSVNELYETMAQAAGSERARRSMRRPGPASWPDRPSTPAGPSCTSGWKPWTDSQTGTAAVLDWFRTRDPEPPTRRQMTTRHVAICRRDDLGCGQPGGTSVRARRRSRPVRPVPRRSR